MTTQSKSNKERREAPTAASKSTVAPRVDILENSDHLLLYADMPGVEKDDLQIRYEDQQLILQASRSAHASGEYVRHEYDSSDFCRAFQIGESIDVSGISADLKNGVLTICLPKKETVKARQIEIKSA